MKKRSQLICRLIRKLLKTIFKENISTDSTELLKYQPKSTISPQIQRSTREDLLADASTFAPGYQLENGEFIIERELGRGGFGITYLAKNIDGDCFVIKTIVDRTNSQSREQWAEFWENFANEAIKLAQCGGRNPHIVQLYKVIRARDLPCIVMEYIEGETLSAIVAKAVLDEQKAIEYIVQIGTALTEIHRQELLHRDVKPLNIMVRDNGGGAVLIDFGIAKKFISGVPQNYLPAVSPGFAPIEQYQWRSIQDTYTDIYALAATLYFAITGKRPQTAEMRRDGVLLIPPKQIDSQISDRTNQAIMRGMNFKGRDRPNSVQVFLDELLGESSAVSTIILNNQHVKKYPEGSLAVDSPYYIERPEVDRLFIREILKPGAVIRIKAARLMGKTSLINRLLDVSNKQLESRTIQLSLLEASQEVLSNSNWFYRWMCARIARELKLPHQLKEYWDDQMYSPTSNCTYYFEEYLLPKINTPLVLSLDEVDHIFPHQIAPDFFGMLRVWHDKASNSDIWKQLRLIIAHSTEVYVKLKLTQSPFNIGVGKELPDLNATQVKDLASRYQLDWNDSQVAALMREVGGHPHLLRLAIYHIADGSMTINTLLSGASLEEGIYGNHLRRFLWSLQQDDGLIDAYRQVATTNGVKLNSSNQLWLSRMGLIRLNASGMAVPRCSLYRQYFNRVLNH